MSVARKLRVILVAPISVGEGAVTAGEGASAAVVRLGISRFHEKSRRDVGTGCRRDFRYPVFTPGKPWLLLVHSVHCDDWRDSRTSAVEQDVEYMVKVLLLLDR